MIAQYHVRFTGRIDERKRPENFPKEIYVDAVYQVDSEEMLANEVNKDAIAFIKNQGMIIMLDPAQIQDSRVSFDKRLFIPMHMITSIGCVVKKLVSAMPEFEDGVSIIGTGDNKKKALLQ